MVPRIAIGSIVLLVLSSSAGETPIDSAAALTLCWQQQAILAPLYAARRAIFGNVNARIDREAKAAAQIDANRVEPAVTDRATSRSKISALQTRLGHHPVFRHED